MLTRESSVVQERSESERLAAMVGRGIYNTSSTGLNGEEGEADDVDPYPWKKSGVGCREGWGWGCESVEAEVATVIVCI